MKEYFPNYEFNLNKKILNGKVGLTKYIQTTTPLKVSGLATESTIKSIPKLPFKIKVGKDEYDIKY